MKFLSIINVVSIVVELVIKLVESHSKHIPELKGEKKKNNALETIKDILIKSDPSHHFSDAELLDMIEKKVIDLKKNGII